MTEQTEKRVLTYGVFDVFDADHVQFLRHIAQLGDRVIVGLARDMRTEPHRTRPFDEQRDLLEASRYVDRVIPLDHLAQARADIVNHNIAILAVGASAAGQFDHLQDLVQVVYLPKGPRLPLDSQQQGAFSATG